jgi:hypothetical protein
MGQIKKGITYHEFVTRYNWQIDHPKAMKHFKKSAEIEESIDMLNLGNFQGFHDLIIHPEAMDKFNKSTN